jgi:ribosome-associated protein
MNKVASGVQLRFNLDASPTLPDEVKLRLRSIAKNRITEDGVLLIEAKRFRTQEQNREDALARLVALIFQATEKPKPRKKTRPSAAANAKRLDEKHRRGQAKQLRRMGPGDHE